MTTPMQSDHRLEAALDRAGKVWREQSAPSAGNEAFAASVLAKARKAPEEAPAPRKAVVFDLFRNRTIRWTAGIAACAGFLAATGFLVMQSNAIGEVADASGRVAVSGVAGRFNLLNNGSVVRTSANSSSIINLDNDRIQVFLSNKTTLDIHSDKDVALTEGAIWINVKPQSGPFAVDTVAGTVHVTGTTFGMVQDGTGVKVYLANGSIHFEGTTETVSLKPDEYLEIQNGGARPQVKSAEHSDPPVWATRLYREYAVTYSANYFPSAKH